MLLVLKEMRHCASGALERCLVPGHQPLPAAYYGVLCANDFSGVFSSWKEARRSIEGHRVVHGKFRTRHEAVVFAFHGINLRKTQMPATPVSFPPLSSMPRQLITVARRATYLPLSHHRTLRRPPPLPRSLRRHDAPVVYSPLARNASTGFRMGRNVLIVYPARGRTRVADASAVTATYTTTTPTRVSSYSRRTALSYVPRI